MNVCSYHLQEAGATPTQEIAYSLATAVGVLDAVRESGQVPEERFPAVFASISFFVNAGIRFIEEACKMRAFTQLWDRIGLERYGVTDAKARRFRYGVQVNSLGLTEAQPENNVQRIVLEMLGVTLSRDARARSLQLPAWNEALGLPRPWDQQWALRMQQVLAYETDLLEYPDVFEGSKVVEARTAELAESATAELDDVLALGGAFEAVDELKGRLVRSHAERLRRIEDGELTVVGVNRFTETAPSALVGDGETRSPGPSGRGTGRHVSGRGDEHFLRVDPALEAQTIAGVQAWRSERDNDAVKRSLDQLRSAAESGDNVMPATIDLAHAGGTTGEWAGVLREVFGEYRAPTGVGAAVGAAGGSAGLRAIAERVKALPGGPPRLLVAKPGLDGHSNGAEQIAVAARDAGLEVIYQGIRLTPEQIAAVAVEEDVDVVGLSILSGSHLDLVPQVVRLVRAGGVEGPVVAGGIIPEEDRQPLLDAGVAAVYTPKDFELVRIMSDIVDLATASREG
jgi:(2R)-ethylmalonyl-CoA mutase